MRLETPPERGLLYLKALSESLSKFVTAAYLILWVSTRKRWQSVKMCTALSSVLRPWVIAAQAKVGVRM